MATKVVIDFDCNLVTGQSTAPTSWENCAKPVGVYAMAGILTLNPNVANAGMEAMIAPGRHAASSGYGKAGDPITAVGAPSNGDFTVGGMQVGVSRAVYSIGAELWATFDVSYVLPTVSSDLPIGLVATSSQGIFRWGDVTVRVNSVTFTSPSYTVVYGIYNGASLVATVTIPDTTEAVWHYCKIHVKLHGSTGLIEVNIDGHAQSVAYVNQNTVSIVSEASTGTLASADFVYFGTPFFRTFGSMACIGVLDNVGLFDVGFPAGRLNARRWTMGTTSIDSNFAAVGTGATTIPDALLLPDDAKAARGTGIGANTLITMATGFDFTGLLTDLIGVNVYLKRPAQLDAFGANRHIAIGLSRSGVHTMEPVVVTQPLHVDNVITPPNQNYTFGGLGAGVFESTLTQANFNSTAIRLLVS